MSGGATRICVVMILTINGHDYRYEMENVCRLFLPQEAVKVGEDDGGSGVRALTAVTREPDGVRLTASLRLDDWARSLEETVPDRVPEEERQLERRLAVLLYRLFAEAFGFSHQWGAVTGVRPVKLLRRLSQKMGEDAAVRWLQKNLLVGDAKADLCRRTLREENRLLALSRPDSFSLYVSIPFCPTRCDYCSFVSHTVERAAKLIPDYVDCLCREIEATGEISRRLGLRLETVYIGGGTPTTLSAEQLRRVLGTIGRSLDLSSLREYTVEAGRPDTITEEKLRALKECGVTRVSINPQTLQDSVLQAIGRRHTAAQFFEAFALARKCGFANLNADLIAGLPGDDVEGFRQSLDGIIRLRPESITVHALAMKRASNLVAHRRADFSGGEQAVRMVSYSGERLSAEGYRPYYLYRQSRAAGNMENVGWALPGSEGLYNVYIMDETHTILACGAGAVTKLKQPDGDRIERVFNFKFPYEYIGRFDELLQRKERVIPFYETDVPQALPEAGGDQPLGAR